MKKKINFIKTNKLLKKLCLNFLLSNKVIIYKKFIF